MKDLVIQERENDLVIGTFGRSAWVIDNINPLRELADNYSLLENKIELFEPSTVNHLLLRESHNNEPD
mgnify:CR=1 FL=1